MKRVRATGWLLLIWLLGGCTIAPTGGKGGIDFEEIFEVRREDETHIVKTEELDVDDDGQDEWLVLYQYDPFQRQEWDNTPIQGVIYDALPCDPPVLHTWRLPFPDNDYLGEGNRIEAFMANWLDSAEPREATNELIISGRGPANTLSIYRYHDYQDDFPCRALDESKQGFSLMGFFRANGAIEWDVQEADDGSVQTVVTTYQRTAYERSQLAIRSLYTARQSAAGETFLDERGKPIGPQEQSVAFMFGTPAIPADSPYPEKAVAAFYLALGTENDNERARALMTEDLYNNFYYQPWGLDLTPDQLNRVLIYSISYTPDREAELTRLEREVKVTVVPVDLQNRRLAPRELTWKLRGFIQDDPEDCEWRLAELLGVRVTNGLGSLPPAPTGGLALVR